MQPRNPLSTPANSPRPRRQKDDPAFGWVACPRQRAGVVPSLPFSFLQRDTQLFKQVIASIFIALFMEEDRFASEID